MRHWAAAVFALVFFAALAVLVVDGQADSYDVAIRTAVHTAAFPLWTTVMRAFTELGSEYLLVPFIAVLVWRWTTTGRRRPAILFVVAAASAEVTGQLLKLLFHRPRPLVFFGLTSAETYSFPSGHAFVPTVIFAMTAMILAASLVSRAARIAVRSGAAGLAVCIGFSRVYLGYHYPSDVLAGYALAIVWLSLFASQLRHSTAIPGFHVASS